MASVFNTAVLLYPGADVLDFSGPVEIFSTTPPPDTPKSFSVTTFAAENPLKAANGELVYVPAKSLDDVAASLVDYDILVVPGAWPEKIAEYVGGETGKKVVALVKKFSELPPRKEVGKRVILSVCSGALILGYSGILAGRTVTTHHMCYELLGEIIDKEAGGDGKANVVKKRWVDAGKTESGVQIVNAGGVSSGIDASLFVVESLVGKEKADWAAEIAEFGRRGQDEAWGVKST
ncbi:class I glutamine amidotransferase-like protein [Polyplosphaeria fusca]|uniref:Class I glutamine amidotransferase-like protein n=1 Tax=Polyplosphaeria fusca TaxID=682080 RepID=A0A9P4UW34_9PLEO|nr:class I glutamine amidotransferase-like protein [Polyplosphaeria fusca]